MINNARVISKRMVQPINTSRQNMYNLTDLVRVIGILSDRPLHEQLMQSIINSDEPISKKQKYLDHERKINDRYIAKNVHRIERLQKKEHARLTMSYWEGNVSLGEVSLFTPQVPQHSRRRLSK